MADRIADPSPEEIAVECAKIQATWSDDEREFRQRCPHLDALPDPHIEIPVITAPRFMQE